MIRLRTVLIIFRKEVLDMLRDKRTLVAMIGLPIVLYPALFVFGSQAAMMQLRETPGEKYRVAVVGNDAAIVQEWLARDSKLQIELSGDAPGDLRDGKLDAYIDVPAGLVEQIDKGETGNLTVMYDEAEMDSQSAVRHVVDMVNKRFTELRDERMRRAGYAPSFAEPIKVEKKNVAPSTKTTGALLGSMMPLIIIVMVGVGAFYPAIDLTAGEKERGTFETLLSTPTQSIEILAGKFLTVFCIAMLTGLANLGSMVATIAFQLVQLRGEIGEYSIHLSVPSVAIILLSLAPLALLISAVMMSIAVLARSFREAQSLLTPVILLLLFPAAIAALPGSTLGTATQLMPIVNFALLLKALMIGPVAASSVAAVLVSTTLFALIAVAGAARVFQREDVVLSVDKGLPLTLRRSQFRPSNLPTPGVSIFILMTCLLLLFYAGTYIQSAYGLAGVAATQWVLFLCPTVFILWYVRVDLLSALSLRVPRVAALPGAILIGIGWVVLNLQCTVWQDRVWPFPKELAEEMAKMLNLGSAPILLLIAVLALSPAVCEELLFRGAFLSGLRKHLPIWATFFCVAAAFGVAHISVHRMPLTALSGIVLTYLAWRSGSIYPGMIAHFIVNSTSVLVETRHMPAAVLKITDSALAEKLGFPVWVLLAAMALCLAGVLLVELGKRRAT